MNIKIHETNFGKYRFHKDDEGNRFIIYESNNGRSRTAWQLNDDDEPTLTEKVGPGSTEVPQLVLNNIPA